MAACSPGRRPGAGPAAAVLSRGWQADLMPVTARVEHVGSLLRPPPLRQARAARAAGEITPAQFKAAEDRAVRETVAWQEEIGLPVVNDGELRRESFQAELTAACDGFAGVGPDAWLWGDWHSAQAGDSSTPRPEGLAVVAPVRKRRNLAAEEFTFVRGCTSRGQGDAAEPDAVRQPVVAGTVTRRVPEPGRVHDRRGRGALRRGPRARPPRLCVHPAGRPALPAAARPGLACLLRAAGMAAAALAVLRDRL